MIDWTKIDGFEWDRGNAKKSETKHGVSCREAEEIFRHVPLLVLDDTSHAGHEPRYRALGRTDAGRLLHAAFTIRGTKLRVISIRPMSRKERKIYENQDR